MNRKNFLLAITGSTLLTKLPLKSEDRTMSIRFTPPKAAVLPSMSVDLSLLLHCISQVETGGDDLKVGRHGERSKFQIKETVWRQHVARWEEFKDCRGKLAYLVAQQHLLWLDSSLPRTTPLELTFREFALAWCWNGGLESWTSVTHSARAHQLSDYATRVTNLYTDLKKT